MDCAPSRDWVRPARAPLAICDVLIEVDQRADRGRGCFSARRWAAPVAILCLVSCALAGCGDRDDGSTTTGKAVPSPTPRDLQERWTSGRRSPSRTASSNHHEGELPALHDKADSAPAHTSARPEAGERILSRRDLVSFGRVERSLGGQHGLAVSALGFNQPVEHVGAVMGGVAWSTSKVPIAMAVIAKGATRAQRADIVRSITVSDNAAAMRLWSSLGGGETAASAGDRQLRRGGDMRTNVEDRTLRGDGYTPFGQTNWMLDDQVRFTAGLVCSRAGAAVLGVMNDVIAGQRWGLGSASIPAQLKGGWGPGSLPGVEGMYFVRQLGVITIKGIPLAAAVATRPADGSPESGTRNLTAIARWLVSHANVRQLPRNAEC